MNSHHGQGRNESEIRRLFEQQAQHKAAREYPEGRISADDDGAFAMMIAVDPKTRTIVVKYPYPTQWIGLKLNDAEQFRHLLSEKIKELKGLQS